MLNILIEKRIDAELPIPTIWRPALKVLANSYVTDIEIFSEGPVLIESIEPETFKINKYNIENYPDKIGLLAEETWHTSVYLWLDKHWEIMLDLSAIDGRTSDLVMNAKIREDGKHFRLDAGLIYVP